MRKKKFSSRERMLATLESSRSDYVPCSFMIFRTLYKKCRDDFEFMERQLELGLDVKVELPELPIRFHPQVKTREWKVRSEKESCPLLCKEYHTPAGKLKTVVKKTGDWLYGDRVPLFDDYLIPRSKKFLVEKKEDLEALRFLFAEPTENDIFFFRKKAAKLKNLASEKRLLVSGGWRSGMGKFNMDAGIMGGDAVMWLCGMEKAILLALDEPEFMEELLEIIHQWNMRRMEIYLDEKIDLLIRRAWYENTDLWSPSLYRMFILPVLEKEIKLVHQAGAKFGYIMTSGVMPLLDDFLKLDIDVLIGVDPVQGKGTDLKELKEKLAGKICLWGGINGFVTIENERKKDVEKAVEEAIYLLAPGGGFILSPVDNVSDSSPSTWENVLTMIKTWKRFRFYQ